jgi:hypothetical protein
MVYYKEMATVKTRDVTVVEEVVLPEEQCLRSAPRVH